VNAWWGTAFSDLKGAPSMVHRVTAGMALVFAVAVPRGLPGQSAPTAAATWDAAYEEITGMLPSTGRGASVSGLVLQRETGQFTFSSGTMVLLTPIRGRTMGATFRGTGTFTFAPTTEMERQQLSESSTIGLNPGNDP